MSPLQLSEGELLATIWDKADYQSSQAAKTLLSFAHENSLLLREASTSISVRVALGAGELPVTLYVITDTGRFYVYWFDHWPQRLRRIADSYQRGLRKLFPRKQIIAPGAATRGTVGLREVADRMAQVKRLLQQTVDQIRIVNSSALALIPDALAGLEGEAKRRMILHRKREGWLRDARIAHVKENTGRLACEVTGCGFDFEETYGSLGDSYAQVHHIRPLSSQTAPTKTRVVELRVVCANCHAMIHVGGISRSLTAITAAIRAARGGRGRTRG
jgi:hypothetical protein